VRETAKEKVSHFIASALISQRSDRLVGERTRIVNRMKGTLARLGIRNFKPTLRKAAERLPGLAIRFRTLRELASIAGQRLHQ
jgi:hypothetical protein